MTRKELRNKSPISDKTFETFDTRNVAMVDYIHWLEDEHLRLINGMGIDKPIFPQV